ncbi:Helix-turn-helix domain of resolvase [Caloranaerobacter azorensis DSM 13643]|uniref:Helix-turn-helix domain of resolvase n=2 Tax=Caloranaerobacter azorensis TaxID=116090 RepID=A0A1M5RFH4_9FIRM|nr:Helix-turn-helix domain of resolvase [Caloranaerobacter azorensis DSM 13643]
MPILGYSSEIKVICRNFFCNNLSCHRKIFTGRFSNFIKPYRRRTDRLHEFFKELVFIANSMSKTLEKIQGKLEHLKIGLLNILIVEIVSRDRSVAYTKGIKDANENIIQIADILHLCHNLLEGIKDFLKRIISSKMIIKTEAEEISTEKNNKTSEEKSKNEITKANKEKIERHNIKKELIKEVKNLHAQGYSGREISKITGLSRKTVKKYL